MEILKIIKEHNVYPKKQLGQNFLIDQNLINKIVNSLNLNSDSEVVEIGVGLGSISRPIAKKVKHFIGYEIDKNLIKILHSTFTQNNVEIRDEDFLKADFNWTRKRILIGNIPYYITGKIIFKIFENIDKFSDVVLMVQKDYADKMAAKVNSKKYSKLAVSINFFGGIQKLFDLNPTAFFPKPTIDSTLFRINISNRIKINDNKKFLDFIKHSFFARRKKMISNLKKFYKNVDLNSIFKELKIDENTRPQELSLDNFVELWGRVNV